MQNIKSSADLKKAIQSLEIEQAFSEQLLKEQFLLTYESLKPLNIIKNTLKDMVSSTNLIDNTLGASAGIAAGYLTRKVVVGTSGNIVRKLIGSMLQFGVTNFVSQHPDAIKSFSRFIFQHISSKKELNSEKQ
jgi:hypothetical protein